MTLKRALLRSGHRMSRVSSMTPDDPMSARARRRIRDELDARGISQRDLADLLTRATNENWRQARIGKVLTGAVELKVDDAAVIASVIGLTLTEVVRDRGLEFYAEMTPTELRILERIRQRPHILSALLVLLDIAPRDPAITKPALDVPKRRGPGRPKNSERQNTGQSPALARP